MIKLRNACYVLVFALLCCKKPYNPLVISSPNSYLVVDGVINLAVDSTVIKLSRTVKLNDKITNNPELGATVTIEGEQSNSVGLYDINNNGHYFTYDINLPATQRYRLKIITSTGSEYLSDFVEVKQTPPIDSIGYLVQNGIVNLYVNAHDPANTTRYYRWDYEETWKFHAKYASEWVLDPNTNTVIVRNPYRQVYYCFGNDVSSNILLTSTTKLAQDIVYQSPLIHIPLTSEKAESKYSVLVKQYALTEPAYNFYQNIKKNTEQLGSIFDAQPSQISGNIHNVTNPNEPVIGYITATNVQTKRIFIAHDDLPGNIQPIYPYDCKQDSALFTNKLGFNDVQNILVNPPVSYIPTTGIYFQGGLIGLMYSTPECADCTLRGTTQTPPFWK
jgi:hypothetical protein